MNTKRCVTIRGNDYERGRQAGEALGYSVKVNLCNQIRHYKENSGYDFLVGSMPAKVTSPWYGSIRLIPMRNCGVLPTARNLPLKRYCP